MTKQEIIKKIVAENPNPDQDLCPELWVYYKNSKGEYLSKNVNTGAVVSEGEHPYRYYRFNYDNKPKTNRAQLSYAPKISVESQYVKCWEIEGETILEVATITVDAHRGGGVRNWEYTPNYYYYHVPRVFLFKGDPHVYNMDGHERCPEEMKTYNHYFAKRDYHNLRMVSHNRGAENEMKRFYNTSENLSIYSLAELYKKSVKPSKKATIMDEVANSKYEWPDLTKYPLTISFKGRSTAYGYYWDHNTKNTTVIHTTMVKDYMVIHVLVRSFDREDECRIVEGAMTEGFEYPVNEDIENRKEKARIVISPKGEVGVYTNEPWRKRCITNAPEYIRTSASASSVCGYWTFKEGAVYLDWENMKNIDKTRYLLPILETIESKDKVSFLINALRHPVLELLYKAGYVNIGNYINNYNEVNSKLKKIFNAKEKKVALNKMLGLNTYQLKKMENIFKEITEKMREDERRYRYEDSTRNNLLLVARNLSQTENFASLSKETTDELFNAAQALIEANLWYQDLRQHTYWWYRNRYEWENDMTAEEAKALLKISKMCKGDEQNIRMYVDTIRLFRELPDTYKPEIDIYGIDNLRSLEIIHDDLIHITNVYKEEYRRDREGKIAEGFTKRYSKTMEKYGVGDEQFMIKAPEKPAELTTEGSVLGHCVGGYLERVGTGGTTILFLRRKEFPSTPFYTIEVSGNDKEKYPRLVQIHGYHNCWLGNNPEAIPFVKRWLDEKGISYTKEKLLSTSSSYGCGSNMLNGAPYGL